MKAKPQVQFHFHSFSSILEVQMFIFVGLLLMYNGSFISNATIFFNVWAERSLHSPMYFFLANLAVLKIFYSSTVVLVNFLTLGRIPISFTGCGTLMFFVFLASADRFLLEIMAYDQFVAIQDLWHCTLNLTWQLLCMPSWLWETWSLVSF